MVLRQAAGDRLRGRARQRHPHSGRQHNPRHWLAVRGPDSAGRVYLDPPTCPRLLGPAGRRAASRSDRPVPPATPPRAHPSSPAPSQERCLRSQVAPVAVPRCLRRAAPPPADTRPLRGPPRRVAARASSVRGPAHPVGLRPPRWRRRRGRSRHWRVYRPERSFQLLLRGISSATRSSPQGSAGAKIQRACEAVLAASPPRSLTASAFHRSPG